MQREYREKRNVFNENGEVMCAGWARTPVFEFNREQSLKSRHICERDCYFINNGEVSLYLSVENTGIDFAIKIAVADLKRGGVISDFVVKKQLINKPQLPESGNNGELLYTDKRVQLQMTNTVDSRFLKCDFIDFGGKKNLYFNINLKKTNGESLNQVAPFIRDRRYFYYKRFVPKFTAFGVIKVGGTEYTLCESDSIAYFDLTRYSKPRKHNYQRLSADCMINGSRFSLCLASRVGDNKMGSENCFFLNNKLEKLYKIEVKSNDGRINRPWYFRGGISAVDITFKPFTVKGDVMAAGLDKTTVVFGRLYGEIKRYDFDSPLVLDNAQAHMIFSEI